MSFYVGNFKSFVAEGFQKCIGQKWTHDDYSDFTVVVEEMEFNCHKFILSSCSSFFNGLLRAEMRENSENRAVLKSMSKETFAVIINAVYKGENGLTKENILPVWRATIFLDIAFLIEMCEYFVSQDMSLTNFEIYYENAMLLESKAVVKNSHDFMIRNFQQITDTKTFFELSADEFCNMVDSHNLIADSEDDVIESILQWINYKHHDVQVQIDGRTDDVCRYQENSSEINNDVDTNNHSNKRKNDSQNERNPEAGHTNNGSNEQINEFTKDNITIVFDATNDKQTVLNASSPDISKAVFCSIDNADNRAEVNGCEPHQQQQQTSVKEPTDNEHKNQTLETERELNSSVVSDRGNHLIQLLRSARMFLVSRGCLETLTRNPVITSKPDAMNIVYDALMYKYKAVNYRNTIVRYRECSNIINGVAFFWDNLVFFYSLLNDGVYILFDKKLEKGCFPSFVGLTAINSLLCFYVTVEELLPSTDNNKRRTYENFKYFKMYNLEDDSFLDVGKLKSRNMSFLLNYNDNVIAIEGSYGELTVFTNYYKISVGFSIIYQWRNPTFTTLFEDDILLFYVSEEGTEIKSCKPSNRELVTLSEIEGPAERMTSFQHGKHLYLLQKNGNLWLVTRSNSDCIEFIKLEKLWDLEWNLHGAVCYNKLLFVFGEKIVSNQELKNIFITEMKNKSLTDVFDSIKVVEMNCQSQVVPMTVDKSRLKHSDEKSPIY
ncbi:unnamed protein product [Lymnaea stagnalis]|uniref:BTB domain-containing protein n=1 Tax=Lymnaea stagnalis TaxID=6523 RepID=A0AAV2INK0_LYMST